ncbi:MAG: hypothetical protein KatS3mg044_0653 [Rhodothermaceae bacterium]|nr:MAG: hypothetical protein KatS3mg044_0653 [Rhodothermaceae bacterium]
MRASLHILAAALAIPQQQAPRTTTGTWEGGEVPSEHADGRGTGPVGPSDASAGAPLALQAARDALDRAGLQGADLDLLIDFSVLPADYLVPAWNMTNRLQRELGARRAVTLGFSGNGEGTFHVALKTALHLLGRERSGTALLVAADRALPGNRRLPPDDPLVLLGDAASALLLRTGEGPPRVLDVLVHSDGRYHDVCFIPGGGLAAPEAPCRMTLDRERFEQAPRWETLQRLARHLLARHELTPAQVRLLLYPGLSASDRQGFLDHVAPLFPKARMPGLHLPGYLFGNGCVAALDAAMTSDRTDAGDLALLLSHGMGYTAGVTLLRF